MEQSSNTRRPNARPISIGGTSNLNFIAQPTTTCPESQEKILELFSDKIKELMGVWDCLEALTYALIYASTQVARFDWQIERREARESVWPTVYVDFGDPVSQASEPDAIAAIVDMTKEALGGYLPRLMIYRGLNTSSQRQDVPYIYEEDTKERVTQVILDNIHKRDQDRAIEEEEEDQAKNAPADDLEIEE